MKTVNLFTIGLVCMLVNPAMATLLEVPTLGNILDDPTLDNIVSSDNSYVALGAESGSVSLSLCLENAGFADRNIFGIFDFSDPAQKLELFNGKNDSGDSVIIRFNVDNHEAWIKSREKVAIGSTFGFYLDSTYNYELGGGFFYSDPSLNTGPDYNVNHALLFDTRDIATVGSEIIIALEDIRINSDRYLYDGDFNDMVVGVSMVTIAQPVPEPTTLALLSMGCLFFVRKRKG